MEQKKKRHHFVPKAYLRNFCDESGKVFVYRKEKPTDALHVTPDATQFRNYYYSQPKGDGDFDYNTMENLFSTIEGKWPQSVDCLQRRADERNVIENIFQFMALQRVRVPAARDLMEGLYSNHMKAVLKELLRRGEIPPPPVGFEDLAERVDVAVDPHMSIHAMPHFLNVVGDFLSTLGFVIIHNKTSLSFITSDNPVIYFDPSLPFDKQLPYTIDSNGGPALLIFPVSPKMMILGSDSYKEHFASRGFTHDDMEDEKWVRIINTQISRFAYEAVIARDSGHEQLVSEYADISPIHEAFPVSIDGREAVVFRQVFGARRSRPKWRN